MLENIGGGLRKDDTGKVISAGKYTPFGHTDYQQIVSEIKQFAASGDACVINTINGDSNVPFFKEIAASGLTPTDCPVVSFSLAEDELRSLADQRSGGRTRLLDLFHVAAQPRKQGLPQALGCAGSRPRSIPGVVKEKRAMDSPMVLSYDGVYLWKAAVEKAGSFDVDKVRETLESGAISFKGPGGLITMQKNHHATKNVYIGETRANGQFKILKSFDQSRRRTVPLEGPGRETRGRRSK